MDPNVWPAVMDYMTCLDPDPDHARQVCRLSLRLFDKLEMIHQLPSQSRDLLRAGALLHDIGWSVPDKPHHKASRDLIMAERSIPFLDIERVMVALIARYHRKAPPDNGHSLYCDLQPAQKDSVLYCSAILRMADALDRSHRSLVRDIRCTITADEVQVQCDASAPLVQEEMFFSGKCMLFEQLTARRVKLLWNS